MQAGDVKKVLRTFDSGLISENLEVERTNNGEKRTYADSTALERDYGFTPKITLREGLRKFAEWYKRYYR